MKQSTVREIVAVGVGLLVFFIIWGTLGWYWYAAALFGAAVMLPTYLIIPKPPKPHAENELVENELNQSLDYARDKVTRIRTQLRKIKRPETTSKVEEILAQAEESIEYARSLGTADAVSLGLLKTLLDITLSGVTKAVPVAGSNSLRAQAKLEAFESTSLEEIKVAMGQVNNSLVSGELMSLELAMGTISGTIRREGLNQNHLQMLPPERSTQQ